MARYKKDMREQESQTHKYHVLVKTNATRARPTLFQFASCQLKARIHKNSKLNSALVGSLRNLRQGFPEILACEVYPVSNLIVLLVHIRRSPRSKSSMSRLA